MSALRILCRLIGHDWRARRWWPSGRWIAEEGTSGPQYWTRMVICQRCKAETRESVNGPVKPLEVR